MIIPYSGTNFHIEIPNTCPHCHTINIPARQWHIETKDTDNSSIVISAWTCVNPSCKKVYIACHKPSGNHLYFQRYLNGFPKGPEWPKPILELKDGIHENEENPDPSKFIITYQQSLVAENMGLTEIAGMGYRKAIEYLVKDWAIQNNPDSKTVIIEAWLGAVIKKFYTGDLKDILERATWLGNDQAHYNKLFGEYDLSILKELIQLIMVELDRQYKLKHYIDTIQSRK